MTEEFTERDLSGATFWGVSLRGASFRDVDFTGVRAHHVLLEDVEIDGFVGRLVINGVDVTDHVDAHDPWQPLRSLIRPTDAEGVRAGVEAVQRAWAETSAEAAARSAAERAARVDGEWSFVETLRHLVFATDKWLRVPILGRRFEAIGLPNSGSVDHPFPGLELDATPTEAVVLDVRSACSDDVRRSADGLTDDDLGRRVEVPESGTARVLDCWHTVLEEEFEHLRYCRRDLSRLSGA